MTPDPDLFRELLSAPDRDRIPGAWPIVSLHEDEEASFAEEVRRRTSCTVSLSRRGVGHGRWAVLEPTGALARAEPPDLRDRWRKGRPIVLPGVLTRAFSSLSESIEAALVRFDELRRPGELARWIETRLAPREDSPTRFERLPEADGGTSLPDPERDLARVHLRARTRVESGRAQDVSDLWVKLGRLSTHELDGSLRVRFSFGRERDEDASPDPLRNRLVAELAERVLPEAAAIRDCDELRETLDYLARAPVYPTQQIAYGNAPEGGALFHHDSFAEPGPDRQLGVAYAQISGRTAWLALSIADLAERVREFLEHLTDGQLAWVREAVFPEPLDLPEALGIAADDARLLDELARPGCGRFARLVNRGPEFTAFLADAGHACLLRPGDAIVLPNRDPRTTAMHSVFCASPDVTYGISSALRARPGGAGGPRKRPARGGRGRRHRRHR